MSQFITMGTGVVWIAAFARYVGPSIYGVYNYGQSVLALVALLINFGIEPLLTRNIARDPERAQNYVKNALFVKLAFSCFVLVPFWIYGLGNWDQTLMSILIICGVGTIIDAIASLLNSALYAFENMVYDGIGQSVRGILLIVICLPLIRFRVSFLHILWISVGLSFLKIVICYYGLHNQVRGMANRPARVSFREAFGIFKDSLMFAFISIIGVVYSNLILLLVRFFVKDDSSLGYFAAAQRLYLLSFIIPAMFYQAIYPVLSRKCIESTDGFAEMFVNLYRYLLAVSFPAAVGTAILAPMLIHVIYGNTFAPSVQSLRILSIGLLNGPCFVMGATLCAMDKQGFHAVIFGGLLALLGLVSYMFIPMLGIEGACWAVVVSNVAGLLVYSGVLFRVLKIVYPWMWLFKVSIGSIVTGACVLGASQVVQGPIMSLVSSIVFGCAVYVCCLVALKAFTEKDAHLMWYVEATYDGFRYRIQRVVGKT